MRKKGFYSTLLFAVLVTGTLDMLSAILLNRKVPFEIICRYIASGVYGKTAFIAHGSGMVVWGLAFHYLIAYIFTAAWFILYPTFVRIFKKALFVGIIYGIITWLIMNFIVVPLSNTAKPKGGITVYGASTGIAALVICIGIPIALIANWYYKNGKPRRSAIQR